MNTITVEIKLHFGEDERAEVERNGVPYSLIIEAIKGVSTGMSAVMCKEAEADVPQEQVEEYLDAMIATDRLKLEEMLKG